jgi:hypothetical protein
MRQITFTLCVVITLNSILPSPASADGIGNAAQLLQNAGNSCDYTCLHTSLFDKSTTSSPSPNSSPSVAPSHELDPYCAARTLTIVDLSMNSISLALDTIILTVCMPACFDPFGLADGSAQACTIASRVGDAFTIASMIALAGTAAGLGQSLHDEFFGTGAATASFSMGIAGVAFNRLTDSSVGLTKKLITDEEKRKMADKVLACVAEAMTATSAALSAVDIKNDSDSLHDNCKTIDGLVNSALPISTRSNWKLLPPLPFLISQLTTSAQCSSINPQTDYLTQIKNRVQTLGDSVIPGSPAQAAVRLLNKDMPVPPQYGALAKIVNQMPNSADIPSLLQSRGVSLDQIDNAIKSKDAMIRFLANQDNMPDAAKEFLADLSNSIDKEIKNPKTNPIVHSPLHIPPTSQTNSTPPLIQSASQDHSQSSSKLSLENLSNNPSNSEVWSSDIWHSLWSGYIFEIVSHRLKVVQKRQIEEAELKRTHPDEDLE